ncbi:acyl transferase/acyl hydrolase/lysophospholipase [Aspergillus ambiguus]|uniref:putative Patatin family phospholipase n=1 Tax=Aspergillus ambiguus TaxID=176160 RepID=UPI003CCE1752
MSLLQDSTIARSHCHTRAKRNARSILERDQRWSRLKSISLPTLSSVLRNPLAWAGDTWYGVPVDGSVKGQRRLPLDTEDRKQILYLKMRNAVSYIEWKECAGELDELEGNNNWKQTLECSEYNPCLVRERLSQLEEARINCDTSRMLFLIRTSLSRDLGDMSNAALYRYSHVGTKELIDRYITTAVDTISSLVELSVKSRCDGTKMRHILEQLLEARQAFGRSALLLSGGGAFGMSHIGVLKTLWENNLMPRIISGASAGSVVAAVFCCHTEDELPEVLENYARRDMCVFNAPGQEETILQKVSRFLKYGSFMDITYLVSSLRSWLGDMTFQEAYNRSRRILNICVSCAGVYELPRLLNYITAPNVLIWSAVAVSCSVPLVFTPPVLMAKDPITGIPVPWDGLHKHYIDGSVDGDLPMNRLSEMFNVNHFIVSQVNPHVVPFLPKDDYPRNGATPLFPEQGWLRWIPLMTDLAKDEVLYRLSLAADMGIFPNALTKVVSVVNQKYSGDINIYPQTTYSDLPMILQNPTAEFLKRAIDRGEQATWPKLSRIRNHCAIELALDSAIQQMRARVTFNFDQRDLQVVGLHRQPSGSYNDDGNQRRLSSRRSSYSHDTGQYKRVDGTYRQSRPPFRRACSATSPEKSSEPTGHAWLPEEAERAFQSRQRDFPSVLDGPDRKSVPHEAVAKRPESIKRLPSWDPESHDHHDVVATMHTGRPLSESFSPVHSRRPSISNTSRQPSNATSQSQLLMTPTGAFGLTDIPPRSVSNLQTCNSG